MNMAIRKAHAVCVGHFSPRLNREHYLVRIFVIDRWVVAVAGSKG